MIDAPSGFRRPNSPMTPEKADQQFREVSKLYEKQFLREMMKAMRSTVQESGFVQVNQAEKIFREQLDQEYVEKWGDRGGIGLADMIYDQLIEKYGPAVGLKERLDKAQGPLSVNEARDFSARRFAGQGRYPVTFEFARKLQENSKLLTLQSPWDGKVVQSQRLSPHESLLQLDHGEGLESRVVFRGQSSAGGVGSPVTAGQNIGLLSPEAQSFFWSVGRSGPSETSVSE